MRLILFLTKHTESFHPFYGSTLTSNPALNSSIPPTENKFQNFSLVTAMAPAAAVPPNRKQLPMELLAEMFKFIAPNTTKSNCSVKNWNKATRILLVSKCAVKFAGPVFKRKKAIAIGNIHKRCKLFLRQIDLWKVKKAYVKRRIELARPCPDGDPNCQFHNIRHLQNRLQQLENEEEQIHQQMKEISGGLNIQHM